MARLSLHQWLRDPHYNGEICYLLEAPDAELVLAIAHWSLYLSRPSDLPPQHQLPRCHGVAYERHGVGEAAALQAVREAWAAMSTLHRRPVWITTTYMSEVAIRALERATAPD